MALTQSPHLPTDFSQQAQIEALAQQVEELRQVVALLVNPAFNRGIPAGSPRFETIWGNLTNYPKFGGR